jgi:para-aminobenzoate synthetase component II
MPSTSTGSPVRPRTDGGRALRILVVDNYDSFVFNLVQYLAQLGADPVVRRNDAVEAAEAAGFDGVLLSPGPGTPEEAGVCVDMVRFAAGRVPVLGVCLGHQAIGFAFGGAVVRAPVLMHGKVSTVKHDGRGIFSGVTQPFVAGRYHSLVVADPVPETLEISARTDDGVVMGLRHREFPIHGVQFHPESVLTGEGRKILRNFLELES